MIAILTILLTVFIVLKADAPNRQKTAKEIFLSGLNGMMMEMPQRLMMQPFTWWLLQKFQVPNAEYYAVFTTAIIWCMGIVTQNVIGKQDFDRNLWIELLSSFVFSLGIGYVFQKSGFIVITMFAHFFERIIYQSISNRKAHT